MQHVQREPIVSPAAWRGDQIGGKTGLERRLQETELVALEALLEATRDKSALQIRTEHFRDVRIDDLGRECRHELVRGRSAVILTGLDPSRYGADGYRRIYWYLGQLIGTPAPQSERGDLLGYVRQEKDNPFGRGYISNVELNFHNDFHEILSLACVQKASQGGLSKLASSLTLHNLLLDERPDLLEALYEGWYDGLHAFYRIYRPHSELPTDYVPYFLSDKGVVSLHGVASMFNDRASKERGETVPLLLQQAVTTLQTIATRPGVAVEFMLEPGEMVFWHNWTLLHARSAFENSASRERVLMRLWLHPIEPRETQSAIRDRAHAVDSIHNELKAQASSDGVV